MVLKEVLIITLIIEIVTIFGRSMFGSAQKRFKEGKTFFKIRIHHGYYGLFFVFLYFIFNIEILLIVGLALIISDAIHHFIVLPIWVGKTEFP